MAELDALQGYAQLEIMPGVIILIDEHLFNIKNAMRLTPYESLSDYLVSIDITITDVLEKTESKAQGALVLRSK